MRREAATLRCLIAGTLIGLAAPPAGCSDDDSGGDVGPADARDANDIRGDGRDAVPDDGSAEVNCDSVPVCATPGTSCTTTDTCGESCYCLGPSPTEARCAQICWVDVCEQRCAAGEMCMPILDPTGNPYVNPDGTIIGGCRAR